MLTFAHPWALLLLALVPAVAWRYWHRPRAAWRFSDLRLLPAVGQGHVAWARWGGLALRVGGLTAGVVALAGPRLPDPATRIPTEGIALALVLDVSASMADEDFAWGGDKVSRLEGVRRLVREFVSGGEGLPGRPTDLISLVTFAARPETACPLTLDHRALLRILAAQAPRRAAGDATTNPGDALAWALAGLQSAPVKRKAIVFLTDGESNVPEGLQPRQAAQLAANLHVPVYAVDAGPDPDTADPAARDGALKAREALKAVAAMTGGAYFRAHDRPALAAACEAIDRLERAPIESFVYRRYDELFAGFALAALACWAVALLLESTVWRQLP